MRCRFACFRPFVRFSRDERGAATIEAVLWLPFFLTILALLADVSLIFHGQSRILSVVQSANRNMAVGRLTTESETEAFVLTRLQTLSSNAQADTVLSSSGLIMTTASVPLTDLDIFGIVGAFANTRLTVRAEHLQE
ncbi:hypothetical protein DEA8626_02327 [Defluviimonas aquaemixtae]|uniref:TadE-like domain-containing protein n=1 Tax=Albidovulum aquaemixtae TaxID=1542388 RepID=A0A2R8B8L0_9RHOB|nr:TadE/TadG family type IV pilus assembly protein [Defluviimonas aquaemixtae]SPH18783.1 hypothetical protein DEA8626_02327 [Defluviimonas aquaemixtae]